jgi:hypothetical protein
VTGSEPDLPWDEGRPPYDPDPEFTCELLDRRTNLGLR